MADFNDQRPIVSFYIQKVLKKKQMVIWFFQSMVYFGNKMVKQTMDTPFFDGLIHVYHGLPHFLKQTVDPFFNRHLTVHLYGHLREVWICSDAGADGRASQVRRAKPGDVLDGSLAEKVGDMATEFWKQIVICKLRVRLRNYSENNDHTKQEEVWVLVKERCAITGSRQAIGGCFVHIKSHCVWITRVGQHMWLDNMFQIWPLERA